MTNTNTKCCNTCESLYVVNSVAAKHYHCSNLTSVVRSHEDFNYIEVNPKLVDWFCCCHYQPRQKRFDDIDDLIDAIPKEEVPTP